jgi:hypothetical protein
MPFTISHVAVVLPFSRRLARWRLLSAAIIGSMAPDFGWFLPLRPARFETHSALSLLTFCLPIGLGAYWVFQRLIKRPVIELLPDGAYRRWREFSDPADYASPLQWLLAAVGVLAGAISHLIWDAFTHEGARGVRMIPALDDPLFEIGGHHFIGTHLLQDVSSLLGFVMVIALLAYGLRNGPADAAAVSRPLGRAERRAWAGGYLLAALVFTVVFFLLRHPESAAHRLVLPISNAAIALLRGLAAALLSVSVFLNLRLRMRPA